MEASGEPKLPTVSSNKERPNLPHITLDFYFLEHGDAEDVDPLREPFKECDIYLPEIAGWGPQALESFRAVAQGKETVEHAVRVNNLRMSLSYEFVREELEMISGSKKPLAFVDYPDDHELNRGGDPMIDIKIPKDRNLDFDHVLQMVKEQLKENGEYHKARETYIMSRIGPEIEKLIDLYPKLKEKKELHVLLSYGYNHSAEFGDLRKAGYSVKRHYTKLPYLFMHNSQGQLRIAQGKEIGDALAARIFVEIWLYQAWLNDLLQIARGDTQKVREFVKKSASRFSVDDIRNAYDNWRESDDMKYVSTDKFFIPKSAGEMDDFLNSK